MSLPSRVRELIAGVPQFLLLLLRLVGDSRVSAADRVMLAGAIVYALSPFDLIPDFIPIIGQLDDLYLLALAIDRLITNAGADLVRAHWEGSKDVLAGLCGSVDELAGYLPAAVQRRLQHRGQGR